MISAMSAELTLPYAFSSSLAHAFAQVLHHEDAELWHALVQSAVALSSLQKNASAFPAMEKRF